MNKITTSLVVAIALGLSTQLSADDIQTQLTEIESASVAERSGLIKEFKYELKNMGEEQRIQAMHKIQAKMPELAQDIQSENIATKIDEIKNADPAQRVKLMNSFKLELAQMKAEEQTEAIKLMQKQMSKVQDSEMEQPKEQIRVRVRVQNEQMDQMQKTGTMEQLNQRQGAEQSRPDMMNVGTQPSTPTLGQQ